MKKIIASILLFITAISFIFAQDSSSSEATVLTIDEAVAISLQNNISIKQSRNDLELYALKDKYSWNSVSPKLNANIQFVEPLKAFDEWSFSASGTLSVTFTPSLLTSIASAKLAYENGSLSFESTVRSVEKNVRTAFYSLLNDLETIESDKKSLEAAKRTYDANLIKYNRGQLDQLTLLSSQYNYESKVPALAASQNAFQTNLDSLKQVLGIELSRDIQISGDLDDILNFELDSSILTHDVDSLPDVKKILHTIKTCENAIKAAKVAAYGPSATLSYSQGFQSGIFTGVRDNDLSNKKHNISLSVQIPLDSYLPWSNSSITIEQAENALESAKLNLASTRTSLIMTIRNTYKTIEEAQAQLKLYEANYELMQKTYDLTLVAYNNGSKDLSLLQTAQDNLTNARRTIQRQKYIIINSVLSLENILGVPFGSIMNNKSK